MRNYFIIGLLALIGCTKGPLVQVQQKQFSGGFFTHWSNSIVPDSQLVTDGTNFYFGAKNGNVFSVRAKGQRQNWRTKLPASVESSVLVDQGKVFAGTGDGFVHALDQSKGRMLWKADVAAPVRGMLTKAGQYVIAGTNEGVVYALNPENGEIVWKYRYEPYEKMKIQYFMRGVVDQGKIFIGFPNGEIVALDASSGNEIWKEWSVQPQARFYDLSSVTLVPQKGILVLSVEGEAVMFTFGGQKIWSVANVSTQALPLVTSDSLVLAAKDRVLYISMDGVEKKSIAYNRTLRPTGLVIQGGKVCVTAFDGSMYVFNESDSKLAWEYSMGSAIQGAPLILEDKIWTLNRRGQLISMQKR